MGLLVWSSAVLVKDTRLLVGVTPLLRNGPIEPWQLCNPNAITSYSISVLPERKSMVLAARLPAPKAEDIGLPREDVERVAP